MTVGKRILFLAGQVGVMSLLRFFLSWVLKFADQKGPASSGREPEVLFVAVTATVVFFVFRFLDALIDPLVGSWSDVWVRRGRERRRLMLYSFALAPLGTAIAFAPTFEMSPFARWALLSVGFGVFFFGYTAYAIPLWSLVDDYGGASSRERSILSNVLGAGILLAVALISVGAPSLIGAFGYGKSAAFISIASAAAMALAYFSQPATFDRSAGDASAHAGVSLKTMLATLEDKRFLAVLLMFSGSQMALTIVGAAAPFVAERLLGGNESDVAKLMGPFLGTAIPCFALVPSFARRVGWERAMLYATLGLAAVYIGVAFLGRAIVGTPMTTAMILFGCGGPMVAVLLGLESEAIANSARNAEGAPVSLYFGMFNLCVKALNGLALLLTGGLVTLSTIHPELAGAATRAMGVVAALLLFAGVGLYFAVRPRDASAP